MSVLRAPLVLVGALLLLVGAGNLYTGGTKTAEYQQLLAAARPTAVPPHRRGGAARLEPRLRSSLLRSLSAPEDPLATARAKLDFYRVVHRGGRLMALAGVLCAIAGVLRARYRQPTLRRAPLAGQS
jgi:hypothetical protein